MTHDLITNMLNQFDAGVERAVVSELRDNTFYAMIYLERNGETMAIDARPSDAIAVALRTKAPIFVEEVVVEGARNLDLFKNVSDSEKLEKWLQELSPDELGKYKM